MTSSKMSAAQSDLAPTRFIMTPAEVATCFGALGIGPPNTGLYVGLPKPETSVPKRLARPDGTLTVEVEALFRLLAAPSQSISVNSYVPGSPERLETRIASDGAAQHFAMVSMDGDGDWDVALLTSRHQLLVVLDEITGLSAGRSQDAGLALQLRRPGFAVLAAISDLLTEERLQSRLDRRPNPMNAAATPIDLNELLRMMEMGIDHPDTSSAVTMASLVSEGTIVGASNIAELEVGVQNLGALGLINNDSVLTVLGLGLATYLGNLGVVSSLLVVTGGREAASVDWFVVFRSRDALLLGVWDGPPGRNENLLLAEVSAGSAFANIEKSIAAAPPPRPKPETRRREKPAPEKSFCTNCSTKVKPGQRFCTKCGAAVGGP